MKKFISVILGLLLCITAFSFGCGPDDGKNGEEINASYIRRNADGTETFMVDGKPFLYLGVECRTEAFTNCDKTTFDEYEKYFEKAADIGFNVIAVSVNWSDIETEKDVYDFSVINKILGFGLKYGIKVDLLWYSALMCGTSHEWHLPEYIFTETPRYQMFTNGIEKTNINISTIYGEETFLRIDDKTFMQREGKVVKAIMEHVYEWEEAREFPNVLIGVQLYNEVDAFPENRLEKYQVSLNNQKITKDDAWKTICTAMDNCGKAFKSGKYKVVTRTNLLRPECGDLSSSGYSPIERAAQIYNLKNVDCVGYDPYLNDLSQLKISIKYYQENLKDNFTHIAENGRPNAKDQGEYLNPDGEILTAVSLNCGYILYELCSPKQFVKEGYGQGILDPETLEDYDYTDKIRTICRALKKVSEAAAAVNPDDFACFNIDSASGKTTWNKTVNTTDFTFNYNTEKGAKGFAIVYGDYIYAFSTDDASLTVSDGEIEEITFGETVNGEWQISGTVAAENGKLNLEKGKVYRIKAISCGKQTSDTDIYKG